MNTALIETILQTYAIHLSLLAFVMIAVASRLGAALVRQVPGLRAAEQLNRDTARQRLQKPSYVDNMKMNKKWGLIFTSIIFGLILPFCLTLEQDVWWMYPVQIFTILMVYDFFYYWAHPCCSMIRPDASARSSGSMLHTIASSIPAGWIRPISTPSRLRSASASMS